MKSAYSRAQYEKRLAYWKRNFPWLISPHCDEKTIIKRAKNPVPCSCPMCSANHKYHKKERKQNLPVRFILEAKEYIDDDKAE